MNCILQFKDTSGRKHWLVTKGRTQNSLWPEYVMWLLFKQHSFFFTRNLLSSRELNDAVSISMHLTCKEYLAKYCFLIVHWAKVWGPGNLKRERTLSRRFTNDFTTITCHQATTSKVHSSQIQTKWSWRLCTMKVKVLLLELYAFPLCIVSQRLRKIGFARISCKCWNQGKSGPLSAAGGEKRPLTVTDNRNISRPGCCVARTTANQPITSQSEILLLTSVLSELSLSKRALIVFASLHLFPCKRACSRLRSAKWWVATLPKIESVLLSAKTFDLSSLFPFPWSDLPISVLNERNLKNMCPSWFQIYWIIVFLR